MKRFDAHVHSDANLADPKDLISKLEKACIYGCCIFSNEPLEFCSETGSTFEERLETVLSWVKGYEDRLFPVLWIHPYEENIFEKVHIAVDRGISAFKIICNNFYVYEEPCMQVLREIAKLDKPVFFHSGILWDSQNSSKYNQPLNWEALIDIEGLRFSMGHCSWPWTNDCIALYGKFLNALTTRKASEMFFDMTPGTPVPYRKDLIEKLFLSGYDVEHNILFGTDATANHYNSDWATKWLGIDGKIMDKMGVSKKVRKHLYHDNLLRFLGKSKEIFTVVPPVPDNANTWLPYNEAVSEVIEKWYLKLGFPKEYNREFYKALEIYHISDAITIDTYDTECEDGMRNLLSFLFMCEALEKHYQALGISQEILMDTLYDLVRYTKIWTSLKGTLYLGELGWLKNHLSGTLFKLGRLQFNMAPAEHSIPEKNILQGEPVLEVHIPEEGPLSPEMADASFLAAEGFFAKYFPEYNYKYLTCHSWLLDPTLKELLKPESNILLFQNRFDLTAKEESYLMLRYIFKWNTNRLNLEDFLPKTNFAAKVKDSVLAGKKFYEVTGVIEK